MYTATGGSAEIDTAYFMDIIKFVIIISIACSILSLEGGMSLSCRGQL